MKMRNLAINCFLLSKLPAQTTLVLSINAFRANESERNQLQSSSLNRVTLHTMTDYINLRGKIYTIYSLATDNVISAHLSFNPSQCASERERGSMSSSFASRFQPLMLILCNGLGRNEA
jgi:hypothetical protein